MVDVFSSFPSRPGALASVTSKLSVDVPSEAEISSKSNGTSSGYNSPSSTNSASWQQAGSIFCSKLE